MTLGQIVKVYIMKLRTDGRINKIPSEAEKAGKHCLGGGSKATTLATLQDTVASADILPPHSDGDNSNAKVPYCTVLYLWRLNNIHPSHDPAIYILHATCTPPPCHQPADSQCHAIPMSHYHTRVPLTRPPVSHFD